MSFRKQVENSRAINSIPWFPWDNCPCLNSERTDTNTCVTALTLLRSRVVSSNVNGHKHCQGFCFYPCVLWLSVRVFWDEITAAQMALAVRVWHTSSEEMERDTKL